MSPAFVPNSRHPYSAIDLAITLSIIGGVGGAVITYTWYATRPRRPVTPGISPSGLRQQLPESEISFKRQLFPPSK